jgi:hypothetical protein
MGSGVTMALGAGRVAAADVLAERIVVADALGRVPAISAGSMPRAAGPWYPRLMASIASLRLRGSLGLLLTYSIADPCAKTPDIWLLESP